MKTKLTTLLLIITISCSLSAQEKLTFQDMFRWFPEGKYERVAFMDLEAARYSPGFERYLQYKNIQTRNWAYEILLPDGLKDRWSSMTQMQSVKSHISLASLETGGNKPTRGGFTRYMNVGEKEYAVRSFGYRMQCIRMPLALDIEGIVLSHLGVSRTGEHLYTLPIYQCKVWNPTAFNPNFYFYITLENEILACENLEILKEMVETGNMDRASIIKDFPFPTLKDIIPDLGSHWRVTDPSVPYWAMAKKLEKENADPELIISYKRTADNYPLRLRVVEYPENPLEKMITLYKNEERAIRGHKGASKYWHKKNPYVRHDKLNAFIHKQTKLKRDKKLVIQELVISDEVFDQMSEFRAERKEQMMKDSQKQLADKFRSLFKSNKPPVQPEVKK